MEYCKLQCGCLLIILYIIFLYYKENWKKKKKDRHMLYESLLFLSAFSVSVDGITAYTVNHLDSVPLVWNGVLHCLFLLSLDSLIFFFALYMLSITDGFPETKKNWLLLCLPFAANVVFVVVNMPSLEYRIGEISNYSMGLSAYTCFVMIAIYLLFSIGICIRRWNYLEKRKRVGIFTSISVGIGVTVYQMFDPQSLVSSLASLMVVLGAYANQEAPMMQELARYHDEMVMGFATLVENRDNSTGEHIRRTTSYAEILAKGLRKNGYYREVLTKDYMKNLLMAAPMHDIGKIAIPDAILQKPGKLTEEEFEIMKSHTVRGGEIIKDTFGHLENPQYMEIAYEIAKHHHEKWNGKGYPDGLKEKEIPLCARIMSIADVFDAVSEDRCYRPAMPLEQCFQIIREGSGKDFDPLLADIFLELEPKVREVYAQGMGNEGKMETDK